MYSSYVYKNRSITVIYEYMQRWKNGWIDKIDRIVNFLLSMQTRNIVFYHRREKVTRNGALEMW